MQSPTQRGIQACTRVRSLLHTLLLCLQIRAAGAAAKFLYHSESQVGRRGSELRLCLVACGNAAVCQQRTGALPHNCPPPPRAHPPMGIRLLLTAGQPWAWRARLLRPGGH